MAKRPKDRKKRRPRGLKGIKAPRGMRPGEVLRLTPEESAAQWDRVFREGIKPHLVEFVPIMDRGGVAVAVFEVDDQGLAAVEAMGHKGETFFELTRDNPSWARLAAMDPVTRRWLEEPEAAGRLFLLWSGGSFLLNYDDERGWYEQPGSLAALHAVRS